MQLFGNYELDKLLGRGGMAEVYRARARKGPAAGRAVALKRLLPAMTQDPVVVDLFVSEADINRYLTHPNIVQMLEVGSVDETFFIAMEYIQGFDLGQVITACNKRQRPLRLDIVCYAVHRVALALDFAHMARNADGAHMGIVHCDVTPSNVFVSEAGDIKLGDFGVAKTRATGAAMEQGLVGKPEYFAPEQILGADPAPTTDVFSLGVILYELLCNVRPFAGKTMHDVCDAIVSGKFTPPRQMRSMSPELEQVVLKALGPMPKRRKTLVDKMKAKLVQEGPDRYESAGALAAALAPFAGTRYAMALAVRDLFGEYMAR